MRGLAVPVLRNPPPVLAGSSAPALRHRVEDAAGVLAQWRRDEVYPYAGEPTTPLAVAQRLIFDICAVSVIDHLPDFQQMDRRMRRFSLELLRQALEESPDHLLRILDEVIGLPQERQAELSELLRKTSLPAISATARVVADRLDFLRGLEVLVFDPDSRERLLERSQLHRILTDHTWLFGEEYCLTVDDQSLTEVLRKHLRLLGRTPTVDRPVLRDDGTEGIVDLMLSRVIPQSRPDEREHLIVELKRPTQVVDMEVVSQVKSYAFAVGDDDRFRDTRTRWTFCVVSNAMSGAVRRDARQRNRPEGMLYDDEEGRLTIWVKTWGQIVRENQARLRYLEDRLHYGADRESAVEYLRRTHEKYLPTVLLEDTAAPNGTVPSP